MISPVECKHLYTFSIESARAVSTVGSSSHRVYLCRDCGQFLVAGHQNEQHFRFTFTLVLDEHLEAAKKAVEFFKGS
jgi:hypothetical protein